MFEPSYARFRGLAKARAQALLAGACQNMKKMARLMARAAERFTCPSARSASDQGVSGSFARSHRRIAAAIGNSSRLNRIHQNKTPPSEKDGGCQQSGGRSAGLFHFDPDKALIEKAKHANTQPTNGLKFVEFSPLLPIILQKGKPVARRGRKATDLANKTAGLPR